MSGTIGRSPGERPRRPSTTPSRDRRGEHPTGHLASYSGILQADAYSGFNGLHAGARKPADHAGSLLGPCQAAVLRVGRYCQECPPGRSATAISPIALAAVQRIDALFDIERAINGLSADERRRVRQRESSPLLTELEAWLREQRSRLSRSAHVTKPIDYMLKRWSDFGRFIEDGRICLTNNAAERALRGLALGRKAWLFAGSDRGADRAAVMFTLIMTAKLNDVDPQAWLADVRPYCLTAAEPFARIAAGNGRHFNRWQRLPDHGRHHRVYTIRMAAEILGRTEDLLWDLSDQLEPEDGMLWIQDVGGLETIAFTEFGLQNLREIISDQIDRVA